MLGGTCNVNENDVRWGVGHLMGALARKVAAPHTSGQVSCARASSAWRDANVNEYDARWGVGRLMKACVAP
jgi:hypothetical protein